ncbi:DNA-binding transcriptional regulator GbsR (MarR family) [Virgibacillus natechei]|uniref:HTH-type transcriptional regulator n=1 Tax=Virgibacillus natechei TaxID=1216297 RepID=A0ABS4IIM7_9BACI|nr:GbsR/MarR family transcriptional regulator [Virgibacillus natechei]MBP1970807.1 DNA-binding transcriptional regulator GbsR (MarR family) [Virgibacillus natechei]UZD12296.1 GbsR/MarR family transcriptional regulator [Virgibacillus natechei]
MEHNPKILNQASAAEKINQAENNMINTIAETMDLYGVTSSVGRLYATLYFQHEPMTLDGMKDKLGMSKPSMSTSVRKLQDIDIVQKVWQKGTRKDYFVAEKDYFQYFKKFFCKKWERETNMFLGSIDYAQKQLAEVLDQSDIEEHLQQKAQLDYDQLEEARKYYHWLQRLIRSIESNEIYDYLPKEMPDDV